MKAYQKNRGWLPWLIGLGMTSAVFALIALTCELRYAINDDEGILRPFMGFGCVEIPDFHLFLHAILVYPLRWLGAAFPNVAWFSWMQLAFLLFAGTLSVKALAGCFLKNGRPAWQSALAGAVYLVSFMFAYCCHVTFTVTAAILGASAVLQILSIDGKRYSDGQIFRALLLALVPVVLAYGLRQITAVPIVAFCALAFCYVALTSFGLGKLRKRSWKPLVAFLIVAAVLFGGLIVERELEITAKGMREHLRWQAASGSVIDYDGFDDVSDEELEQIGWSPVETKLVRLWYFIDENISTESFEKIAALHESKQTAGLAERLDGMAQKVQAIKRDEPVAWRSLYVLGAALLLCLVGLLLRRKGVLWQWFCLLAGVALAFAMLLYLGLAGRLMLRAALMALLPFAAIVFGLMAECLPAKDEGLSWRAAPLLALACAVAVMCAVYAAPMVDSVRARPIREDAEEDIVDAYADLDEYAAENPDCLIIYDISLGYDLRMFPSTEFGTPANLMFWGGWSARSPEYMRRLAAFGIDGEHADATIFLREDVCLARNHIENDPSELCDRISELTGQDVYYQSTYEFGGVHLGQFFAE